MKNIITIQHTQSVHHTNGMVGSWTDWDLTDLGVRQARRIGQRLKAQIGGQDYAMYASDLLRARRTAEIVGEFLGLSPILAPELRERNLGRCVGKSVQWLRENLEMQERTIDDRLFSDAESRRDEWNRLLPFFQRLMQSDHENIIIVSHGDLLSVFNAMWLGLPPESLNDMELFGLSGGVSFLHEGSDGKRRIRRLSDLSFISE